MRNTPLISHLSELASPILTVYVNTLSPQSSVHTPAAQHRAWLEQEAKRIAPAIAPHEERAIREQIVRVEEFLHKRTPEEKALVIFAGPQSWEVIPLHAEIENELHWGRPALTELEWFLSENKPHCIVVVDRKGVRFFRYWLGEMQELLEQKFDIDVSQWKKKELGHVAGQGVKKTRGSQRDTYRHRVEEQFSHLCRKAAATAKRLCERKALQEVFLVGSDRLTHPMEVEFQHGGRSVVTIHEDFGGLALPELQERLKPAILAWEHKQESELVENLLGDEHKTVIGIDETLAQLQKGKVRTVVLARHLNGELRECIECGWTDRSADPVCPVCGRERRPVELREVLLDMVRTKDAQVEVVSGAAEEKLNQSGGLGGWLRGRTQAELR